MSEEKSELWLLDEAYIVELEGRIAELERVIADNCDPCNATDEDAKIIQECFYETYPENL